VVVTDHQTAGRGRLDRTWLTPEGSALTFSAVLAPRHVPVGRWPWLPLLTGVAVAEGVRRATGLVCSLKWPNDVLVEGAKVAGILVERVERPAGAVAVVGVGVKDTTTADELPVATASSLLLATGHEVRREDLLVQVLAALGEGYDAWQAVAGDAADGLRTAYLSLCATLGLPVRVALPDGRAVTGTASGVDTDGRLEVTTEGGRTWTTSPAPSTIVRPGG
jgi:BirA family transcriptional regulator, biotin operon repressor / biotin---[acetyl-CoA-carboxylase] ligase